MDQKVEDILLGHSERRPEETLNRRIAAELEASRQEGQRQGVDILSKALMKFAPDLAIAMVKRWEHAKSEADEALAEFLAFLRAETF